MIKFQKPQNWLLQLYLDRADQLILIPSSDTFFPVPASELALEFPPSETTEFPIIVKGLTLVYIDSLLSAKQGINDARDPGKAFWRC